jgi:hypothetical protein
MSHISLLRGTALAALVTIGGLGITGCALGQVPAPDGAAPVAGASAPVVEVAQASTTALPVVAAPVDQASETSATDDVTETKGNVAELQGMIHGNQLTELRTTYNGTYGASLLLYGKEMTYYIVLFQQKNFWRVIKTMDQTRAEEIYGDFVKTSAQLADVEVRRAVLAAQKAYTERLIELAQQNADRLQADIDVAHQQQTIVAGRQKEAHEQATALQAQKDVAQSQLRALRRQVHLLERQSMEGLTPTH